MPEVYLSRSEMIVRALVQHYNPRKYWSFRKDVISYHGGVFRKFLCELKLLYIKRCDAFNNASLGTHMGFGAEIGEDVSFPHGLYGIVISHNASIGNNATIYHQVTIGEGKNGAPIIGDNVFIGAGAIIIGKVRIGNNVKIGAGCIVTCDVPDDATIVSAVPRIIVKGKEK